VVANIIGHTRYDVLPDGETPFMKFSCKRERERKAKK
jgi:hypothetical protein